MYVRPVSLNDKDIDIGLPLVGHKSKIASKDTVSEILVTPEITIEVAMLSHVTCVHAEFHFFNSQISLPSNTAAFWAVRRTMHRSRFGSTDSTFCLCCATPLNERTSLESCWGFCAHARRAGDAHAAEQSDPCDETYF